MRFSTAELPGKYQEFFFRKRHELPHLGDFYFSCSRR